MKKSILLFLSKNILICLFVSSLFSACSSEYHWVKVHSSDPTYANLVNSKISNASAKPVESVRLKEIASLETNDSQALLPKTAPKDHGFTAVQKPEVLRKAGELEKTLSAERKSNLRSTNLGIRALAVKETLHEQLIKNSAFSKLSVKRQNQIENVVSHKMVKESARGALRGINSYLVIGLVLLIPAVLFSVIPEISFIGLLFFVVALVFIVLGLIQMLA